MYGTANILRKVLPETFARTVFQILPMYDYQTSRYRLCDSKSAEQPGNRNPCSFLSHAEDSRLRRKFARWSKSRSKKNRQFWFSYTCSTFVSWFSYISTHGAIRITNHFGVLIDSSYLQLWHYGFSYICSIFFRFSVSYFLFRFNHIRPHGAIGNHETL